MIVHREVDDAATELEQQFLRVSIPPVLFNSIVDCLLRQAILQLESGNRQAIDEYRGIKLLVLGVRTVNIPATRL
jgi:hypothetical protein